MFNVKEAHKIKIFSDKKNEKGILYEGELSTDLIEEEAVKLMENFVT